jgi:beclin 1
VNHGFTLVDETGGETPVSSLGRKLRTTAELFDVISGNGDIDHPLCEECTDALLDAMDQQLKLAEEEAQEYQAFLQKMDRETEDDSQGRDLTIRMKLLFLILAM